MELKQLLFEFNQPTNKNNPSKRYNSSTGVRGAMRSKTTRITRKDRIDAVKSKDLNQLKNQIDASFQLILAAADNTPVESFIIGRLNQIRKQLDNRIDQEIKKQDKMKK